MKRMTSVAAGLFATLSMFACAADNGNGSGTEPADTGTFYDFVQTEMKLPANASDTKYSLDIDDDGTKDNQLGSVLGILASQGIDIQTTVDENIASGDMVLLHSVRADDLSNDGSVSWQVYVGDEATNPDFSGNGAFTVAALSPKDATLAGSILGGQFKGGPASVTLQLALVTGQPVLPIQLIGTKIEGNVTATGCSNAKLGGAITKQQLDEVILPAVTVMMNANIQKDPESSGAKTILSTFDTIDMNGTISVEEVKENGIIKSVLAPDVDMFDAAGKPGHDGKADSLSLGVGIACTKATLSGR